MYSILLASLIVGTLVGLVVTRYRRLRGVPGPLVCAVTDLWRAYHQNTRNVTDFLDELHSEYGPVVKIGPNTVSISKASAVPTIYTTHGEFRKADSYNIMSIYVDGQIQGTVGDVKDEAHNTLLKRALGSVFAFKNVQDYESLVDASASKMFDRLDFKGTVDVFDALRRFQVDFLMKAAFSVQGSLSETDHDIDEYTFHARMQHWCRWQPLWQLEAIFHKSFILNKIFGLFRTASMPRWAAMANDFVDRRLSQKDLSVTGPKDLLDKWLDAQRKQASLISIDTVRRMVSSTVNAGFDTTALTMTMLLYNLLKVPNAMRLLQDELLEAMSLGQLSDTPQWTEVNKLPYLDAVIKETMRYNPFLNVPLERVVPEGGANILGFHLPAGTIVGCSAGVVGRDSDCYGPDAHFFNPDRWLMTEPCKRIAMERGSLGFGAGKRICIGKHIAILEMKKLVASLLTKFNAEFAYENVLFESIDGITNYPKPMHIRFTRR